MIKPIGKRTIVTSRGIKEEMDSGLIIPQKFLRGSNLCRTEDGREVIIKDKANIELPDGRWLVNNEHILATVDGARLIPHGRILHVRKCQDPEPDEGIITSVSKRETQFAEILAVGPQSGVEPCHLGWLAYVEPEAALLQAVEDGNDEWLVDAKYVMMIVEAE